MQNPNSKIISVVNSASNYGRLEVSSPVDLNPVALGSPADLVTFSLSGSYKPKPGEVFNIIHNTNSGTAIRDEGAFSGLAQSGTVLFNSVALAADYHAGGDSTFSLTSIQAWLLYLPLIWR